MQLPNKYCSLCPRLVDFRKGNSIKFPNYYNGVVPPFGNLNSALLIVGLAPGLHGANQTGRPFTNDYAGDILYFALKEHGLAQGNYGRHADDGFELINVRITNAVRCVPPKNKPEGDEFKNCLSFLRDEITSMNKLQCILSLGRSSHCAVLKALNIKQTSFPFSHGAIHNISDKLFLADSYHTSRYNINTGVLTEEMFSDVIRKIKENIPEL